MTGPPRPIHYPLKVLEEGLGGQKAVPQHVIHKELHPPEAVVKSLHETDCRVHLLVC